MTVLEASTFKQWGLNQWFQLGDSVLEMSIVEEQEKAALQQQSIEFTTVNL